MAKRYTAFAAIPEGYFKPEGTCGRHHCIVVRQGDERVVVGSVAGRVTLKPGDTLGYDCGTVWLVPRPGSYKDPIRRVLALAHLSQKLLQYSAEPVEYYAEGTFDQDFATWPEAETLGASREFTPPLATANGCSRISFTGGEAVVLSRVVRLDTKSSRRIEQVVVRPTADKAAVAEWLGRVFFPDPIIRILRLGGVELGLFTVQPGNVDEPVSSQSLEWGTGEVVSDGEVDLSSPYSPRLKGGSYAFKVYEHWQMPGALSGVVIVRPQADVGRLGEQILEQIRKGLPKDARQD